MLLEHTGSALTTYLDTTVTPANELCLSSAGDQRAWVERAVLLGQRADPGRPGANGPASGYDERRGVAGLG